MFQLYIVIIGIFWKQQIWIIRKKTLKMKTNEERLPELEALESLRFDFECEFELIMELTKFWPWWFCNLDDERILVWIWFCCCVRRPSNLAGLGIKPISQFSLTKRPIHQSLLYFYGSKKMIQSKWIKMLIDNLPL